MSSTPSVLRELVAHLGRAQRAVDAGQLDEAERAVNEVLAIDPGNVHATDLRNRISRARPSADVRHRATVGRERPAGPARRAPQGDRLPPGGGPPSTGFASGQVTPAAWSAFEARVRARRADRAVANAQAAIAGGDREAAVAALAELDIVSPGDPRRLHVAEYVELLPVEPVRPQWPPEAPRLAPHPAASVPDRDVADMELARDAHPHEIVLDPSRRPAVRTAARRGRGARFRTRTAVAGLLVGALLLAWALTRPSFVQMTRPPVTHQDARAESPADPTSASIPAAADALADTLTTAIPDPAPSPDAAATAPAASTLPLDQGAPAGPATEDAPPAEARGVSVTPPESTASTRSPSAASGEPTPPPATAVPSPPTPALDLPVQALAMPPVETAPARVDASSGRVAPVALPAPDPAAHAAPSLPPAAVRPADVDATAVRGVLEGYASAYSALDAEATQRLWPGVDLRGLRRAFDQLSAQTVQFDRCDVKPAGDLAEAVCVGRTTWVPRVGDRSPRSEARTWQFALARDGSDWLIERVQAKR